MTRAMQRISSRMTFWNKRIFPVFWFGFLAFFEVIISVTSRTADGPPLVALVVPLVLAPFGYWMMKKLVWDLADDVFDAGDELIFRFGREEERIPLSNIVNLSYSWFVNPARVTLTLRTPSRFGKEVSFSPPQSFIPFVKSKVIGDLIERVDAARRTMH